MYFHSKGWGHAWWWSCFSEGDLLRTLRSRPEKWQWSKGFGFSSVGLSLEFWSLLELKSDRNAVCIFITTILLPRFHFHFPLPLFSSSSLPPFLPLASFTFFPVSSLLVNTPPACIYLWSRNRIKLHELWVLSSKLNVRNKYVQFLWMKFWVKKKEVKLIYRRNIIV